MAAPPFVAAEIVSSSATPITVDKPTGVVDGDLMLAFVASIDAGDVTPEAGWTLIRDTYAGVSAVAQRSLVFYKWAAGEGADYDWTVPTLSGTRSTVAIAAYRDVDDTPIVSHGKSNLQRTTPSVAGETEARLVCFWNGRVNSGAASEVVVPVGMTTRAEDFETVAFAAVADQAVNAGATGTRVITVRNFGETVSDTAVTVRPNLSVVLRHLNRPPNAPALLSLTDGEVVDRTDVVTAEWLHSDPDIGDTQSGYDIQARLAGTGTWTVEESATTIQQTHPFPALTFTAGDWEWQVRTYDQDEEAGAWSASGFFTAADPPAAPTWVDPLDLETITTPTFTAEWTASADAYQIRIVADDAGTPDEDTIYSLVSGTTATTRSLTAPGNNITVHLQVRRQVDGLWSAWTSIETPIEFTEPAIPLISVVAGAEWSTVGAVTVTVTNPEPVGDQPEVLSNDIWRRPIDSDTAEATGDEIRVAAGITGPFVDWAVASGQSYAYRAVANGDNGATSQSDWSA